MVAFYASRVGIDVGASEGDVLGQLPLLRPYCSLGELRAPPAEPGANGADGGGAASARMRADDDADEVWAEQLTMVFAVVRVLSNFGELRLVPALLPSEAALLRSDATMDEVLRRRDVSLVGELCHCLRVFGLAPEHPLLARGLAFLLDAQHVAADGDGDAAMGAAGAPTGGWPARDGDASGYARFHATMCATMALFTPHFRGFGPGSSALLALLHKWQAEKGSQRTVSVVGAGGVAKDEPAQMLPCGVSACKVGALLGVAAMYSEAAGDDDDDAEPEEAIAHSLAEGAHRRLVGLLKVRNNFGATRARALSNGPRLTRFFDARSPLSLRSGNAPSARNPSTITRGAVRHSARSVAAVAAHRLGSTLCARPARSTVAAAAAAAFSKAVSSKGASSSDHATNTAARWSIAIRERASGRRATLPARARRRGAGPLELPRYCPEDMARSRLCVAVKIEGALWRRRRRRSSQTTKRRKRNKTIQPQTTKMRTTQRRMTICQRSRTLTRRKK